MLPHRFLPYITASTITCIAILAAEPQPQSLEEASTMYQEKLKRRGQKMANKVKEITDAQRQNSESREKEGEEAKKSGVNIRWHIEMVRWKFSMHVPQVEAREQVLAIDVPVIEMSRQDVKVEVPVIVMKRQEGPTISYPSVEWRNDGIGGTPSPTYRTVTQRTYYDVPTVDTRLQGYSFDVPRSVGSKRIEMKMVVPTVVMRQQDISLDYPRYVLDDVQVGPDQKRTEQLENDAKTDDRNTRENINAAKTEMEQGLKADTLWYAPYLVAFSGAEAIKNFREQARAMQEELRRAIGEHGKLVRDRVGAGDPRRIKVIQQLNACDFYLRTYTTSANLALYQTYKNTTDALIAAGIPMRELAQTLANAGMPEPQEVDFTKKYSLTSNTIEER